MINSGFYTGVVEDRNDPEQLGRVRVRIHGYHTDDKTKIPTTDLPWAVVMQPTISSAFSGVGFTPKIVEGAGVIVIFADGDNNMQYPIVMGTLSSYTTQYYKIEGDKEIERNPDSGFNDPNGIYPREAYVDAPSLPKLARNVTPEFTRPELSTYLFDEPKSGIGAGVYPYNQVRQSETGHFEEWDDTPNNERLGLQHKTGTYREINAEGQRVVKVITDVFDITFKDNNIFIGGTRKKIVQGDETVFINGDWNVVVGGAANIKVVGDANIESTGNINLKSGSDINIEAVGAVNIRGSEFELTSSGFGEIITGGSFYAGAGGPMQLDTASSFTVEGSILNWSPSGGPASVDRPDTPDAPEISKPSLVQTLERPLTPAEENYIKDNSERFVDDKELEELGVNYPPPPPADSDKQFFKPQKMRQGWPAIDEYLGKRFLESKLGLWKENGFNPKIVNCYKEVGFNISNDKTPWCAAFAGTVLKNAGFEYLAAPKSGLSSLAYSGYGQSVGLQPERWRKWDIIVFTRNGGGHIGFIYGVNKAQGTVIVLGGNQSDNLKLSSFPLNSSTFPIAYVGRAWSDQPDQDVFTNESAAQITSVV